MLDQPSSCGVSINILDMNLIVLIISNPMIREAGLPYLHGGAEIFLCPERKASLDELHRALQRYVRRYQNMEMVRHDHILLEQTSAAAIGI